MKAVVMLVLALTLLVLPGMQSTGDACPACEARWKAHLPLNQHDIWNDATLRDTVPLNCLSIESEPTLRDSIPLNCLNIESEPTLRDTVPEEPPAE